MNTNRNELPRNTLGMNLAELLKEKILAGDLPQGSSLDELTLSSTFEVSRSVVRDALAVLVESGLVVKEPRRPARVRSLSRTDVKDIFDARLALELMALEKLTLTEPRYRELLEILAVETHTIASGDIEEYIKVDSSLHDKIVEYSDNQTLLELLRQLKLQIQVARTVMTTRRPARMLEANREHQALLTALKKGDKQLALSILRNHIESAKEETLTWFDSPP